MNENGKKTTSQVSPCFNEEENVEELCRQVMAMMSSLEGYYNKFILIGNVSNKKIFKLCAI